MATINDIVIVHVDHKPGFYARIEDINPDVKPGWWQVKLLVLTFPLQLFTWILDENQIAGADFTMGGTPIRMELVASPVEDKAENPVADVPQEISAKASGSNSKVVSLAERRKK